MKLTKKVEAEIKQVLDDYWNSYFNGDIDHWATYLVNDYRNIGGTEEEIWNSKKEILDYTHRVIDQLKGVLEIRNKQVQIIPYDPYVMVHELMDIYIKIQGEWAFYQKFRLSSLIQQQPEGWKVLHQHGSYPDSKTQEGEAFVFDTLQNENLKLQQAITARTIELEQKNRELEIETSLERVRAVAMGMTKPDDLLDICKQLYSELQLLSFTELRNTMIHRFFDERKYFINYDYSEATGGVISPIPYQGNRLMEKFITDIRKENDSFSELQIAGKELQDWKAFRKANGEYEDPRLNDIQTLYYYNYAVGESGIGISTYQSISAEKLHILARFRNVFDLAYKRYIDITKAEVQAREAQIQLALERVRARSMAMHKSEELSDLSLELVKQVQALGVATWFCAFNINDEDPNSSLEWGSNGKGTFPQYRTPREGVFLRYYEAGQNGETLLINEIGEKECPAHYEYLCSLPGVGDQLVQMKNAGIPFPVSQIDHVAFFKYGYLLFITYVPVPEAHAIFKRFAKVFEQTYTRFLDLQKAEAQAREAQIETALERVRSRSLAMHKSDELNEVVSVLFERLKDLQIPFTAVGIAINIEGSKDVNAFVCGENEAGLVITNYRLPYFDNKISKDFNHVRENQLDYFVGHYSKEEKDAFYTYVLEHTPEFRHLPENIKRIIFDSPSYTVSMIAVNKATFNINDFEGKVLEDDEVDIIKRFAKVFDQAYTRFLDLQKAEAQTREAQINLAVERVRARALAMYKSEEILELVFKLKQEMMDLDIPNVVAATIHLKEKDGNCTMWDLTAMEYEEGKLHQPMVVHYRLEELDPDLFIKRMWDNKEPYFLVVQDVEDFKRTIQFLRNYGRTKEADESEAYLKNAGIRHGYHPTIPLHNGRMCIDLLEPPSGEIEMILTRMGGAFDLAYKRFEDLKNSEAQLREAQIEGALEKVRSRTMGMQQSYELGDVATVLFTELNLLVNNLWTCGFVLCEKDRGEDEWWLSTGDGFIPAFFLPNTGDVTHANIYDAWERGETYHTEQLEGKALQQHYDWLMNIPVSNKIFEDMLAAGFTLPSWQKLHCAYFSYGYLVMITQVPCAEEQIFKRFAQVFDQTYTRFLDLQKAEAQTRQAKIETALEKVRARSLAMQVPEELIEVAEVLRHEMGLLGVEELETCSIYIHDQTIDRTECWYALKDTKSEDKKLVNDHFPLSLNETWVGREMEKFFASLANQVSIVMQGDHRKEWINYCEEKSIPLRGYYGEVIPDRTYHLYKFSHGAIGAAAAGDISNESWDLLKRAASVFSLAYSRFKDLTQARFDLQRLKEEKQRAETALSELQTTQKQLIQAEKMASLGELTAGIAHEIQNPLNFVNNFSEVSNELIDEMNEELQKGDIEEAKAISSDIKQNLEKIHHHGKRADAIVKGMLQHSSSGIGKKEPTDINKLADEYLRLAYHGLRAKDKSFNATMKTDFDESIGNINIIPQDIGRVILNLITNAFYVVNEKKNQGLEGYEPTVTVKTLKNPPSGGREAEIVVSVKDNGNGIPQKILDKIFQPFFTTKPTGQGTGLGLSLSYDIVKAHGGEIKVYTKENEGTEFTIQLPI